MMKFHDWQSSERCIRKLISRHCLEKTCTSWNDYLFLITDDHDFRPQTWTNGLVFRECKHTCIKNIFEDVYFTKNSFHITLTQDPMGNSHKNLLFRNHWANCNQTLVEWSLDRPLPKYCPAIAAFNQDGRQAKNREMGG